MNPETKKMELSDLPTCDFIKKNMAAEMEAIEGYSEEASRTDDMVWKRAIQSIANDEMHHHEVLDYLSKKLNCSK